MERVELEEILDSSFEELSEECIYSTEGGVCSGLGIVGAYWRPSVFGSHWGR